jgi:hypothetical protein
MATAKHGSLRAAAASCIVGATATTLGGIAGQAIVQPATSVSHDRWSYPWSSVALIPISLLWAALHGLIFYGVLGFARSGPVGSGRGARLGATVALAGTALLSVGELASIPIRAERTDDAGAAVVAIFAVAVLLTATRFLFAGITTLRARLWGDWRRFTPLSVGIAACAVLALSTTRALPTGVAVYGFCLLGLGVALYTESPPTAHTRPLNAQGQYA